MKDREEVHYNMSRIRGKDTSIEIILRKALKKEGYTYRKNVKKLPGCPDIVLCKYHIAIFCDGDFFHGYDFRKIESQLKTNKEFWLEKIRRNQKRDNLCDMKLVGMGYLVLRFWEHEIRQNLNEVLQEIDMTVLRKESELQG